MGQQQDITQELNDVDMRTETRQPGSAKSLNPKP